MAAACGVRIVLYASSAVAVEASTVVFSGPVEEAVCAPEDGEADEPDEGAGIWMCPFGMCPFEDGVWASRVSKRTRTSSRPAFMPWP